MDNIVSLNVNYTYEILLKDIANLKSAYSFLEIGSIGNSVLGRNIPYIKIGSGAKEVFYSASYHASEWITTPILMKFVEDFCIAFNNYNKIYGYDARIIFASTTIYIVPMVNPDGVDLVTRAIRPIALDSSVRLYPNLTPSEINKIYYNAKNIADSFPDIPFPSRLEGKYCGCRFKNLPTILQSLVILSLHGFAFFIILIY